MENVICDFNYRVELVIICGEVFCCWLMELLIVFVKVCFRLVRVGDVLSVWVIGGIFKIWSLRKNKKR